MFGAVNRIVLKIYGESQNNVFKHQAFGGKTKDPRE